MILVNGEYQDYIPISDRGFQYGDGLFETIEILEGKPVFLNQHLKRLTNGCQRLQIPPPDLSLLTFEIKQLCDSVQAAVLKIIISRGSGGRGYIFPVNIQPSRVLSLHPFPEYPIAYSETGIKARICQTRLGLNPALAGLKHLNRLEQVLARSEWKNNDLQEGIMLDAHGQVIEGTMSNLFFIKDSIIYTSPITLCGVAGITRDVIMQVINEHALILVERFYFEPELLQADEIFVCNSIIGIWPVKELNDKQFGMGEITRQLQQWLTKVKAKDIADAT